MFCKYCSKEIKGKGGEFCDRKCSNLYYGERSNAVLHLVKDYNNFYDIPLYIVKKLYSFGMGRISVSLRKYKLDNILQDFKKFKYHNRLCPYCQEFFTTRTNKSKDYCPNPSCIPYYEAKETNRVAKIANTKEKKYGDSRYNNREKFKNTHYSKTPEEIEELRKNHAEAYHKKTQEEKDDIKRRARATYKAKTGYECPFLRPDIIEKSRGRKVSKETIEKRRITNKVLYGKVHPIQNNIKNYEDYTNPDVWGRFNSIQEASDYFNISNITALRNFHIYSPDKIKKQSIAQTCIYNSIQVEDKVNNARNIIPPKELDIYLPSAKLAIEYDGLLFHSQGVSKHSIFNTPNYDKNYHLQKTLECNSQGIQLLHIFEGENIDLWLSMINAKLGLNSRIYARNCYAVELRNSELRDFLNENHLQGFCNASIAIGLYLQNTKNSTKVQDFKNTSKEEICNTSKLVAAMTFSKPRFSKGYDYELVRFCSLKGYNIIGGASKLWKFFLKKYNPKSVISYANLRFSNGGLYENLGFSLSHRSEPNYYYFKDDMILHSRNKFQKHKLKDLLEIYDADKSEVENMFANGYRRIFDCGNLVYEWFAK